MLDLQIYLSLNVVLEEFNHLWYHSSFDVAQAFRWNELRLDF